MSPRVLLFLGLAVLAVAMVNANCPCGRGVDACTCDPLVVRPPKIHRPFPVPRVICSKFSPPKYESTDPCCCKNYFVGVPPRPAPRCPSCYKERIPEPPAPCHNGPVHTIPFSSSDFVAETPDYHEESSVQHTGVNCGRHVVNAADAVSLHLAYAAGLNRPRNVKEGMLSYGFSKTPEYQPIKKEIMNIPEEKIAVVDKKILELRLPSSAAFDQEEEVMPEPEEEYAAGDATAALSYADLGYMPEKGKPCAWKPASPCHHPSSHPNSVVIVSDGHSEGGYVGDSEVVRVNSHEDMYSGSFHGCGGYKKCAGICGGTCKACSY